MTVPLSINDAGWVAGAAGSGSTFEGFLRTPDGSITTFQVTGTNNIGVGGMNSSNVITGWANNNGGLAEGFVRAADGTITTFQVSGAENTSASSINDSGIAVGFFGDGHGEYGFVRTPDGSITQFDVPGASSTFPVSINNNDEIAGYYQVGGGPFHGFLRLPNGEITTFDAPGCDLDNVSGINSSGEIAGFCTEGFSFVRLKKGSFITISKGRKQLDANAINGNGTTTGTISGRKTGVGFIRTAKGKLTKFEVPDKSRGTTPFAINSSGVVTGESYYSLQSYGFLYTTNK
ncbi:MAG: hypothetical protein WDM89_17310 [Rhizomicrobium sp.]